MKGLENKQYLWPIEPELSDRIRLLYFAYVPNPFHSNTLKQNTPELSLVVSFSLRKNFDELEQKKKNSDEVIFYFHLTVKNRDVKLRARSMIVSTRECSSLVRLGRLVRLCLFPSFGHELVLTRS